MGYFMPVAESVAKRVFVAYFISFYFHLANNIESIDLA